MAMMQAATPSRFEKWLAVLAAMLGMVVIVAVVRGRPHWVEAPPVIWAHLLTVLLAVVLTPALLLMRRGTPRHRALGAVWMITMFATAIISLFVRVLRPGHFSLIHLFSLMVIIIVPRAVLAARRHDVAGHRRAVLGMVIGGLMVAGWLTFPFGRMLGRWLLG